MEAKLVVVGGKANMGEVKLRLPMTIGRGRKADLIISHPTVSRIHCELTEVDGTLVVRDNDSSNGTFLDDEQVKQTVVKPGQILRIGPLSFRAEYEIAGTKKKAKPTVDNAALAATQTMTYEELMGDDESSVTTPPTNPPAKSKPAAKADPKKPGKPAAEPTKKRPAAPEPTVGKDIGATDDDFDFGKDIEFFDEAGPASPPTAAAPVESSLPTDDDGDFDFLADLEEPAAKAPAASPNPKTEAPAKVEAKTKADAKGKSETKATAAPAPTFAPAPEPKVEAEPDFDFLADLGGSDGSPGSSSAVTIDESSELYEPPDLTIRKGTPTETFDQLGHFKTANADSLAPEPEVPAVNETPEIEEFAAFEEVPEAEAPAAEEQAAETAPEIAESPKSGAEPEFDFLSELDAAPEADTPKLDATVPFDVAESEPAPVAEAPPEPESIAAETGAETAAEKSGDDDAFFDFLADEPAAATESPTVEPEAVEEPAIEEPAKAEVDAWSFDVETEPAAEVTAPFLDFTEPKSEPASEVNPPVEVGPPKLDDLSLTESKAAEPTPDELAFDFLADAGSKEPVAEVEAKQATETEATIEFFVDDADKPASAAPTFAFAPPEAESPAEPQVEQPFAFDEPATPADESIAAAPSVAAVGPTARTPIAKKPSFLDKVKMLFSAASKKKPQPTKAKGPASAKKPAADVGPTEKEAASAFAAAPVALPPSDAPIPLSDEPIKLSDDFFAPSAEVESKPAVDEFAVGDFLADAPAAPEAVAPGAVAPAPAEMEPTVADLNTDAFAFADEPTGNAPTGEVTMPEATAPAAEPDAFDFLADEPVAEAPPNPAASEPVQAEFQIEELAFDVAASASSEPATPAEEPTIAAPQSWTAEDGIPLEDELFAESATDASAEPIAATPSTAPNDEFDFGSFLDDATPSNAAESAAPPPDAPIEAVAFDATAASKEAPAATDDADLADDIFGFDVEPAPGAVADLPAPEPVMPEASASPEATLFDVPAATELGLEADVPSSTASAADPDLESYLFAPETSTAKAPASLETPATAEASAETASEFGFAEVPSETPFAPMSAEAAPVPAPAIVTPSSTRVRSIDVDAPITTSQRVMARVTIRGPRIDVPHMEPDVPAGRTFNRTTRRPTTVETASESSSQQTLEPGSVAAPLIAATAATSFGDMTADLPPVSPPDEFADSPSDDFNFFGDEPSAVTDALVAGSPAAETPASDTLPDDLFSDGFGETTEVAEAASPATATSSTDEPADEIFDFFADAPADESPADVDAPVAEAAAPAKSTDEDNAFDFLADELATSEEKPKTEPTPAKKNDQDLDDFFSDLGM